MKYIVYFIQSLIMLILTPIFIGIIKNFKANFIGYKNSSVFQPYWDLKKSYGKSRIKSKSSSFITTVAPIISLSSAITTVFLIPIFFNNGNSYFGNLFIIFFLLGIIKFLSSLLGLDAASTFGGMGSSRELFISMFAEPIMFILVAFLYMETNSFNIFNITLVNSEAIKYNVAHTIAAIGFVVLIMAENARMPVDNPETHLELTMIHEAMILDISGRDLAFMEYAGYIKLIAFITIFINCFFPIGVSVSMNLSTLLIAFAIYILKVLGVLTVIALIESTMAKFRLFRIPELLSAAFSLSLVAIVINYF